MASKRLGDILRVAHPQLVDGMFVRRATGIISINWKPLIKIIPQPGSLPTKLQWNNTAVAELNINKRAIIEAFTKRAQYDVRPFNPWVALGWAL